MSLIFLELNIFSLTVVIHGYAELSMIRIAEGSRCTNLLDVVYDIL